MTQRFVLDAWAVLAFLQGEEPAAARVRDLLDAAARETDVELLLSIINLGEVFYIVGRAKGQHEAEQTLTALRQLPWQIVPATDTAVLAAAAFKMKHPVSYADAFAATAAQDHTATLLTGDPELLALSDTLRLEAISRA
ncbi:MAG: type II toxin-antitoxin system VapC family toxin [Chloroflexi bacterium]|nr:type II toxin-antitoxin system VapC family toxin [Chloroflexota bacterium]